MDAWVHYFNSLKLGSQGLFEAIGRFVFGVYHAIPAVQRFYVSDPPNLVPVVLIISEIELSLRLVDFIFSSIAETASKEFDSLLVGH